MATSIPFALGPSVQGVPASNSGIPQFLQQALQGNTAAYFTAQNSIVQLTTAINNGTCTWIPDTDTQGNPVYFAELQDGSGNNATMVVGTTPFTDVINGQTQPDGFQWNGQNYDVVGQFYATLSWNNNTVWTVDVPAGVLSTAGILALRNLAWSGLIQPLLSGFLKGISSCLSAARSLVGLDGAAAAAGDAADTAEVPAAAAEGVEVSMTVGAAAFTACIVLAALPFILSAIAHATSHNIKVYNLTNYDLTWATPFTDDCTMNVYPAVDGTTTPVYVLPAAQTVQPNPNLNPVTTYSGGNFAFQNTNDMKGLSWAMQFTLTDPKNNNAQVMTSAVMFDLPLNVSNSLDVTTPAPSNLQNWAQKNYGLNKDRQMSTSGGPVNVTVTYDLLTGKQALPSNPNVQGFFYNSLIVFAPA